MYKSIDGETMVYERMYGEKTVYQYNYYGEKLECQKLQEEKIMTKTYYIEKKGSISEHAG